MQKGNVLKDTFGRAVVNGVFSTDGKQFMTIAPDSLSSFITVWSAAGDSLYSFRCKGTEVNAVFHRTTHPSLQHQMITPQSFGISLIRFCIVFQSNDKR